MMNLVLAGGFFIVSAVFVHRSFYGMRIKGSEEPVEQAKHKHATA